MTKKLLPAAAFLLLALACTWGAAWTAYWSLRFGLTPRPPLTPFHLVVRFVAVAGALCLWPFRRDPLERAALLCTVVAAGSSALFGLGVRSTTVDVARLLFHFLAYSLGALIGVRGLRSPDRSAGRQETGGAALQKVSEVARRCEGRPANGRERP